MVNMPRGVYHSALKGGARLDQGKTVAGIPNFMLKMYETNKQPGLKPGLAGIGLLLTVLSPGAGHGLSSCGAQAYLPCSM